MSYGLSYNELIFYDLETSGLDKDKHEIIQIAAIHMPTGDTFETKVLFDVDASEDEALRVNHYNAEDWADALSQEEALKAFNNFCKNHKNINTISNSGRQYKTISLCGYNNLRFDYNFIETALAKHNIRQEYDFRQFDVYPLVMWLLPGLTCYKLTYIAEFLECSKRKAHDALADVETTIDVTKIMIQLLHESDVIDECPKWANV